MVVHTVFAKSFLLVRLILTQIFFIHLIFPKLLPFFIKDLEYEVFIMSDLDNGRRKMQVPEIGWTVGFHLCRIAVRFQQHFQETNTNLLHNSLFFQVLLCFRMQLFKYRCSLNIHSRPVARSENPGGARSTVVGIICPPGWDRVNCSAKNWEG